MKNQKAFSLLFSDISIYQQVINYNKECIPDWLEHTTYNKSITDFMELDNRFLSDIERIHYLKNDPNLWYWDADTVFVKPIDFELKIGYPYMFHKMGKFDICVILGNGCKEFFEYLYSKYDSKVNQWFIPIINGELKDSIMPIPAGYFNHLALNHATTHVKEGSEIGGYGYSVKKINGELKLKIRMR